MVMRQVQGQTRKSGQDQVRWGSDTAQWLPGVRSDEAGLKSSQEDGLQVRVQINEDHGQAQAWLWKGWRQAHLQWVGQGVKAQTWA